MRFLAHFGFFWLASRNGGLSAAADQDGRWRNGLVEVVPIVDRFDPVIDCRVLGML
jgi:hypothetical protein